MSHSALTLSATAARANCSSPNHHNIAADTLRSYLNSNHSIPCYSTSRRLYSSPSTSHAKEEQNPSSHQDNWLAHNEKQRLANKEFFTNLLSSAATKRDAKAYISRLKTPSRPQPALAPVPS